MLKIYLSSSPGKFNFKSGNSAKNQGIFAAGNQAILYRHACAQAYIEWFNKKAIAVWDKNIIPIHNTKQYNSTRI